MITRIEVSTSGPGLYEITAEIREAVRRWSAAEEERDGLLTIMIQHTSASLTIQENADPSARRDLEGWLDRLVPEDDPHFTHTHEGPDDMPSHIKAALTSTTLSIPVVGGEPALGTWQGVYVWEHRARGSRRRCVVHIGA